MRKKIEEFFFHAKPDIIAGERSSSSTAYTEKMRVALKLF